MTEPEPPTLTEDALLEAALHAVDQPLMEDSGHGPPQDLPTAPLSPPAPEAGSPTLAALAANRRPKPNTVCETCPNSVWFASATEVKCYCRVMFLVVWSTKEPNQITGCDGMYLGQDQA